MEQTSRDFFAAAALTGLVQSSDCYGEPLLARPFGDITDLAYAYADAMMESREKDELNTSELLVPSPDWDPTTEPV